MPAPSCAGPTAPSKAPPTRAATAPPAAGRPRRVISQPAGAAGYYRLGRAFRESDMIRTLLACAVAASLLAGCEDTNAGFKAVGGLESLGGAFGPPRADTPAAPVPCRSGQTCR